MLVMLTPLLLFAQVQPPLAPAPPVSGDREVLAILDSAILPTTAAKRRVIEDAFLSAAHAQLAYS